MSTQLTNQNLARLYQFNTIEFDDAFYNATLKYYLRHLAFMGNISNEILLDALKKSLQICYLANINSKQHFKQVYLYNNATSTLQLDCFMSKNGFYLMLMQMPSINKNLASWLWKLSAL